MKYLKLFEYIRPTTYDDRYYDSRYINTEEIVSENVWYYAEILGEKIVNFLIELFSDDDRFIEIKRDRDNSRLVIFIHGSNFIDFMDNTFYEKNKGLQLMISGPVNPNIVNDQYKLIPELIDVRNYLFEKFKKVKDPDSLAFRNFKKTQDVINVINSIDVNDYKLNRDIKKYNL